MGGLGNQLFQYAFGKSIAKESDKEVAYDLSWFDSGAEYDHDHLYLDYFQTDYEVADESDVNSIFPLGGRGRQLAKRLYKKSPLAVQTVFNYYRDIDQDQTDIFNTGPFKFRYSPKVYQTGNIAYFDGYWQANQYVDSVAERLGEELTFQEPSTDEDRRILSQITQSDSVSIHLRRGDYTANNMTLSLDYYTEAIEKIQSQIEKPSFYIFSDDVEWVENELEIDRDTTYVNHNNAETCYEDLRLMSECDHNIIANSTFSWWGAWLNQNEDKTVIAPQIWLGRQTGEVDILPRSWETILTDRM
jgi:hypothetical protein